MCYQSVYGALTRWVKSPILVFADGFDSADLQDALDFWNTLLGIEGTTFQGTTTTATADIVFRIDPRANLPADACGAEGPTRVQGNVIESGSGVYLPVCPGAPPGVPIPPGKTGLAHGLGHILGLLAHTPSGSDLMGSPSSVFNLSPLLAEVMLFLYGVAPGTMVP